MTRERNGGWAWHWDEGFVGWVTTDKDWCLGMEDTLAAPALLECSSLRQPEGQAQVAALPTRGSAEGVGALHTGWVTWAVVPGEVSDEASWSPHPCSFPLFFHFCYLFSKQCVRGV